MSRSDFDTDNAKNYVILKFQKAQVVCCHF